VPAIPHLKCSHELVVLLVARHIIGKMAWNKTVGSLLGDKGRTYPTLSYISIKANEGSIPSTVL